MDSDILLSIVIPTYNRYKYLEGCLRATCSIESNQMEVIIQDNTADNSLIFPIMNSINDSRIKYFHKEDRVTVSENCDIGVSHATGKYICLLGDDDTICSNIIDLVKEMDNRNIDTCVFGICTYHWPDLIDQLPNLNCFETIKRKWEIHYVNSMDILKSGLKQAFQSITEFPRVYHAIASRKIMNKIKNKAGTYFPGPSPDMANAIGCTLYSKVHIRTDIPVMISGYGGVSTGGMGRKRQHKGSLTDKPWLPKNILDIWDKKIPQLWMGDTIWPASAVTALKALSREDLIKELNYGVIYGETLIHERSSLKDIMPCQVSFLEFCTMWKHIIARILKKVINIGEPKKIVLSKAPISLIQAKEIQDKENLKYSISEVFLEKVC